jgi:hypothetical protein
VSGDHRQWCLDNGEGDLIPCGADTDAEQRAKDLAETLNLGHAARARAGNRNAISDSAQRIYDLTRQIDLEAQAVFPPGVAIAPKIKEMVSKLVQLQEESKTLMKAFL